MLRDLNALQLFVAIIGIGMLIAWHELGHYVVARLLGMRVLKYSIGFGPKIFGKKIGEIEYQVSALPLGGFVQIKGMSALEPGAMDDERSYVRRPRWARFLVLTAGPGFNYLMAFFFFFAANWFWPSPLDRHVVELRSVVPGSAAEAAGLQRGDLVLSIDGSPTLSSELLIAQIAAKKGDPIEVEVMRGSETLKVSVTPLNVAGTLRIGVGPAQLAPRGTFGETMGYAFNSCWVWSKNTLSALGGLVQRKPGAEVQSIVAIVQGAKEELDKGLRYFIWLLAVISVNLGLFNLLPIPALDGIKMLFLAIEGAIRRDLNAVAQVWVNATGLLALLLLMAVLMVRDTVRLLG